MIPKCERDVDRAICEAATPGPWAVDPNAEDRTDVVSVSQRCAVCYVPDEGSPDGAFIAAARERLPLYIDALDKIDERMATIEELTRGDDTPESRAAAMVLRILRGGQ